MAATSYSMYTDHLPKYTVDGDRDVTDKDKCFNGENSPTDLIIDLKKEYVLYDFTVYIENGVGISNAIVYLNLTRSLKCFTFPLRVDLKSLYFKCRGRSQYITIISTGSSTRHDYAMNICEIEIYACSLRTYGRDCTEHCYCKTNKCDRESGNCHGECLPQWKGPSCTERLCPPGMYGKFCAHDCHCEKSCNPITGECSIPCDAGWTMAGGLCQKRNVAFNKRVFSRFTEVAEKDLMKTVDGNNNKHARNSNRTCFRAFNEEGKLKDWTIDLGMLKQLELMTFSLFLHDGYAKDLTNANFVSYLDDTFSFNDSCQFSGNITNPMDFTCDGEGRYLMLTNPSYYICEMEAYDCGFQTFGINCTEYCYCLTETCHIQTGVCPGLCAPGWMGMSCSEGCPDQATYGASCSLLCSDRNCKDSNDSCHPVHGTCASGCNAGWRGAGCTETCTNRTYGANCAHKCINRNCNDNSRCDAVNGTCLTGCQEGWNSTDCATECNLSGTYGVNCTGICRERNCVGNSSCHSVTGECDSYCTPGWKGYNCLTECDVGFYGDNCVMNCNERKCTGNSTCHTVSGRCLFGCILGWSGVDCQKGCSRNGSYGVGCLLQCKQRNCQRISPCNPEHGKCMFGCMTGWKGLDCIEACLHGSYGENCNMKCADRKCKGESPCHHLQGACKYGCSKGFVGIQCLTKHVKKVENFLWLKFIVVVTTLSLTVLVGLLLKARKKADEDNSTIASTVVVHNVKDEADQKMAKEAMMKMRHRRNSIYVHARKIGDDFITFDVDTDVEEEDEDDDENEEGEDDVEYVQLDGEEGLIEVIQDEGGFIDLDNTENTVYVAEEEGELVYYVEVDGDQDMDQEVVVEEEATAKVDEELF